ncbi:acetylxylan esterase [Bacteroides sp. OttesenSCG-928-D19]|nr:acetylxylan esterase [Bacteroides sp. OttesenSCG-928-D19]
MKLQIVLMSLLITAGVFAQRDVNYDESKVPAYVLPDVLLLQNGKKVETKEQWETERRPEVLELFTSQMYGRTPVEKIKVRYETLTENPNDLGGKATSRQVKFIFSNGQKEIEAILLMYIPNKPKGKVPVFVGYNFKGNHSITLDTTVYYPPVFHLVREADHPDWVRGNQANRWCIEKIIDRGFALATMCYHDIFPDKEGLKDHSIVSLFSGYNPASKAPDEWQAIGAWAWGSSRIADYLETEKRIDATKIAIMGHSRQGKAALWAGAQDTRFQIVISNDSGSGGAALSKRVFGETVAIVSSIKPAWFCPAFNQYRGREADLPFDQHELLALIAPRKLYVASAEDDQWADPRGEFLSAYYAGSVYKLYGLSVLPSDQMPIIHQPIMEDVGYHIRSGKHDVTDYDWERFMDFADKHF